MLLLLDSANVKEIEALNAVFPIDGITTNPSIVAKERRAFKSLIGEIRDIIGPNKMLHVQVLAQTSDDIVREAALLRETFDGLLYVKIPVSEEGVAAIRYLRNIGIQTTATTIFTPQQAFIAAKVGASYVAPYVNRIDNICGTGVQVVSQIVELFRLNAMNCDVLGASFANMKQVNEVALAGAQGVTINSAIMKSLVEHPLTQLSIENFTADWIESYGMSSLFPK